MQKHIVKTQNNLCIKKWRSWHMNTSYDYTYYQTSAEYIFGKTGYQPEVALILGSALGGLAEEIENPIVIDYADIPHFLLSTVEYHAGKLIMGDLGGKKVVCMSGRFHYYEGYAFEELATPIRVFHALGVKQVILTNAAGAVNPAYLPGDIMVIRDHINLLGASPTRGANIHQLGPRFFDVSDMYTKALRQLVKDVAAEQGITLREGVYYYTPGPHFETPAEIQAIQRLGADAVGMSTVTEALTAAHCQMKLLGLSLISNMAAGILDQPITAEEVIETGERTVGTLKILLRETVKRM